MKTRYLLFFYTHIFWNKHAFYNLNIIYLSSFMYLTPRKRPLHFYYVICLLMKLCEQGPWRKLGVGLFQPTDGFSEEISFTLSIHRQIGFVQFVWSQQAAGRAFFCILFTFSTVSPPHAQHYSQLGWGKDCKIKDGGRAWPRLSGSWLAG